MKRSVSSAPRPDATGAPSAAHSGATVLTNTPNQQSASSIRAHESPPITQSNTNPNNPQSSTQSTVSAYAGILPHGTQIHSTVPNPNSVSTPSVVHITNANINQIIRPIASSGATATGNPTIHTLASNVGINLSALGTPVTIPASAVSAAQQSGATNLIIHRQSTNNSNNNTTGLVQSGTTVSGGAQVSSSSNVGVGGRFSTVIPTSLHLNKVSNIANINQITVSQATAAQIQIATGTTGTGPSGGGVTNHSVSNTTPPSTVTLGQHQVVAPGSSVAIATQLVTTSATPQQSNPTQQHQIVYSPRVQQTGRLVQTTQQSAGSKLTNSNSASAETMQSLAQFQTTAVAYTTGGPSGPGRPPSVPVSTQPQLYSTGKDPVIRHKVQMASITQQQTVSGTGPQISTTSRRLKVEDALSYLDKVKYKFGDQPQVYNDFLDIMKEFKSESIDTPGVITRVSTLFNGHPELIEGFNTFLPPGYKIEVKPSKQGNAYQVSVSIPSPTQSTATVVHTQQGIAKSGLASPPMNTTQIQNSSSHPTGSGNTKQGGQLMQIVPSSTIIHTTIPSNLTSVSGGGAGNPSSTHSQGGAIAAAAVTTPLPQQIHQSVSAGATLPQTSPVHLSTSTPVNMHHAASYQSNVNSTASSNVPSNVSHSNNNVHHITQTQAVCQVLSQVDQTSHTNPQNQRVEFNHAINYVNKIKNRFQSQPDRYKKFLEILHTYQKEQRIMKESNNTTSSLINSTGGTNNNISNITSGAGIQTSLNNNDSMLNVCGGGVNVTTSSSQQSGGMIGGKHLTEAEVYSQVAKLFENQEDLLAEFGQFLPDATSSLSNKTLSTNDTHIVKKPLIKPSYNNSMRERERERENREREHRDREHRERGSDHRSDTLDHRDRDHRDRERDRDRGDHRVDRGGGSDRDRSSNSLTSTQKYGHTSGQIKRSPPYISSSSQGGATGGGMSSHRDGPPLKKHKIPCLRDVSLAEAGKYGTLHDYAFFDKVRKALRSQEVYDNFLRCLVLYNEEVISRSELVQLSGPFLGKFPELFKWFKDFIGHSDSGGIEPIPNNVARQERPQGDNALEVDLTTCKRLGASYCALPKPHTDTYSTTLSSSAVLPGAGGVHHNLSSLQGSRRCSGRTQLCREVLNDTWVSFPTWSEDSTFVTNRKTQFEEYIYRCEDERFELDVVIETNAATIRVLEGVWRRIQRFSADELARFRLDDTLGGTSAVLHQRALRRIYGDKAADIVDGLKRNPGVAVQVVLRRLRAKEEEWREAQKSFNKIWREQNEKFYLKSLDHQGINFKQNDVKSLRSKSLFNEIETLYDERHEQHEEGATSASIGSAPPSGPHLILSYAAHLTPNSSIPANPVISGNNLATHRLGPIERSVLDDAAGLLIHHVRRQTGIQKQEKARIKALLKQFIPDLFHHPRQQLSDDERDDDDDRDDMDVESNSRSSPSNIAETKSNSKSSSNSPRDTSRKTPPNDSTEDTKVIPMDIDVKKEIDMDDITIKTEDDGTGVNKFEEDPDEYYTLFMANNHWYLFLRLHAVLCSRLATMHAHAQRLIAQERDERSRRKQSTAVALKLKPQPEYEVEQYYPAFLDMVKNVLDGNMDSNAYEDTLREMFGIHAYIAFTLDKVVSYAVRQLQHCATERGAIECCNMFLNERRKAHASYNANNSRKESLRDKDFFRNLSKDCYSLLRTNNSLRSASATDQFTNCYASGAGGPCATALRRKPAEIAYQRAAEAKLRDENCFKIYIYKNNLRVTIELLDTDSDEPDSQSALSEAQKRSNYIERFANDSISTGTSGVGSSGVSSGGVSDGKSNRLSDSGIIGQDTNNTNKNNTLSDNKNNNNTSVVNKDTGCTSSSVSEKGTRKRFDRNRESLSTSSQDIKEEKNVSDQDESEHGSEYRSWSGRKATFLKRNLRDFRQRAQRNNLTSKSASGNSGLSEPSSSSGVVNDDIQSVQSGDDIELIKSDHHLHHDSIKDLERKLSEKGLPQRITHGGVNSSEFVVDDKTQCRFNLNSYKMVYIVNKESYLYKKDAFMKAKECHPQVTKHLSARFRVWHKRWLSANVTESQQKAACDWLMGRTDGLCANRTRVITNNDIRRTPYTTYNRYRVERLVSTSDADSG